MKILLLLLLTIDIQHSVLAQDSTPEIVGHSRNQIFVLAAKDYYLVELLSPLKFNCVKYDTLVQTSNGSDSFSGRTYTLLQRNDDLLLLINNIWTSNKKKGNTERVKLHPPDSIARSQRNWKHNYFYQQPYGVKMANYSRLLDEKDKLECMKFDQARTEMYKKAEVLGIEEFRQYFDLFVQKYNLN